MEPSSEAKRQDTILERMENALAKCAELMERHLAAGELTVPARALYFILRDAGFGTAETQTHEVKQSPKEQLEASNEHHHRYGMRR
jgi:hypothetical protein